MRCDSDRDDRLNMRVGLSVVRVPPKRGKIGEPTNNKRERAPVETSEMCFSEGRSIVRRIRNSITILFSN